MEFRKTSVNDIKDVMKIIKEAQNYFKDAGIDQWQNNYPNEDTIMNDIKNDYSYVLVKDGEVVATAATSFDGEKTYERIYEGQWLTEDKYSWIHRIAVTSQLKGLGLSSEIIKNVEKMAKDNEVYSIKIDTHEDNKSMQRLLTKNNFKRCGTIYLEDNSKRVAFEKVLDKNN